VSEFVKYREIQPFPFEAVKNIKKDEVIYLNAASRFSSSLERLMHSIISSQQLSLWQIIDAELLTTGDWVLTNEGKAKKFERIVAGKVCGIKTGFTFVILIPESVIIKFIGIFLPPSIPDGLPDMSLLEGIASTFLLEVISQIHDCCDVLRLDSVFVIDDLSFFRVLEGALSFDIKIMVGNKSAIITLLVSKESLLKLEKTKDIKQISLRNSSVLDLKVEAIIVLGISSVSSSVLNSIEEGDLLFPDSVFYPEMVKILICKGAAGILVASCKVEDQKVVVEDVIFDRLEYVMKKNLEVFDNEKTEIKGTEGEIPGRVGEIPVEVIVEAGRIEMTVGEIASLTKGSIIKLNRALSADVVLTCGGKIVAYGVLVSVEGEMGIQIVKVCQ